MAEKKSGCERCKNGGWIIEKSKSGAPKLNICSCEAGIKLRLSKIGIPPNFLDSSFDNFKTVINGKEFIMLRKARTKLRDYVNLFPSSGLFLKKKNGFLIKGTVGAGKTHLCAAVARGLVQRGYYDILFVDFKELLDNIKSTFSNFSELSEEEVLEPVLNSGLLIIDDVGSERNTEWTENVFARIINYRYNRSLPVIITTNYFDREVKGALSDELLEEKIGSRVRSRLYEICEDIELVVPDYRRL